MWDLLLASITVYVMAKLFIHLLYKWLGTQCEKQHVIIVTNNHQMMIEWVVRSVFILSWMKGKSCKVTVVDQCSDDDTEHIVRQLSYNQHIEWIPLAQQSEVNEWLEKNCVDEHFANTELMDLRNEDPLVGWSFSSSGER